jgi:hypothetical protein
LTASIKVGTKRVGREVLLPESGREQMHLKGVIGIDALEDINQVDVGIDALEAAGGNQTLDDADVPCAAKCWSSGSRS